VKGWQDERVLSLQEAAHLLNPQNDFPSSCCNYKTGCTTQHCVCQKKGATCSSKCHGGSKCSNHCESDEESDNKQPQTKRRKYGKTKLESESSDEGVNNQPQTKRGKKNHSNTPPSSGDTNQPLTKKNRGNTGKAVVISSDEESADEGKWLPELFLRADDKKLIETGDWLMTDILQLHRCF